MPGHHCSCQLVIIAAADAVASSGARHAYLSCSRKRRFTCMLQPCLKEALHMHVVAAFMRGASQCEVHMHVAAALVRGAPH
eukprot:1134639-Pelagomonas_calceolata.AAC.1